MVDSSGMGLAPELLIRELVIVGLQDLAGDPNRFAEIVEREDRLQHGSQDTWTGELWKAYQALMNDQAEDGLRFVMGYPMEAADLPCVSIVKESSAEDTSTSVAGDVLSDRVERVGTDLYVPQTGGAELEAPRLERVLQLGTGWTSTVQIGSWTTSPELSILLDACLHNVLFRDKRRLSAAGVHDVGFAEGGSPTDEAVQLKLRVGYVPMQRVTLQWTRAQTRRSRAAARYRVLLVDPT